MAAQSGGGTGWLLYVAGDSRQHVGNDGYLDSVDAHYSWDSRVPNHAALSAQSPVAVWDGVALLGVSVIDRVSTAVGIKVLRRCPNPSCLKTTLKARKKLPRYRCYSCGTCTDRPVLSEEPVTSYVADYAASWIDLRGSLGGDELREACLSSRTQHSMRRLDWRYLVKCLSARVSRRLYEAVARLDLPAVARDESWYRVRARAGQGEFREGILNEFGNCCAFTGAAPATVLEAAHLYSYATERVHHEHGGLPMRRDVHRLFDRGDLSVNPTSLTIDADSALRRFRDYKRLHGAPVRVPLNGGHQRWLAHHWRQHRSRLEA